MGARLSGKSSDRPRARSVTSKIIIGCFLPHKIYYNNIILYIINAKGNCRRILYYGEFLRTCVLRLRVYYTVITSLCAISICFVCAFSRF